MGIFELYIGIFLFFFFIIFSSLFFFFTEILYILLSLIMVFSTLAFSLILHSCDFIGIIFLIIYAGAISMLVLFAIMLLNLEKEVVLNFDILFFFKKYFYVIFTFTIFTAFLMNFVFYFLLENNSYIKYFNEHLFGDSFYYFANQVKISTNFFFYCDYPLYILSGFILLLGMVGPIIIINLKK